MFCLVLCSLLLTIPARAIPGARPDLPEFDVRNQSGLLVATPDSQRDSALLKLKTHLPAVQVDFDSVTGSPAWVGSTRGFLGGRNGSGAVSASALAAIPTGDSNRVTRAFLADHSQLFGHGPEALDAARIQRDFVTAHNGMRTVVWEQQVDGISVFEALLISHTTSAGDLVNLSSHFLPSPDAAAASGNPNRSALVAAPPISAAQAIINAAADIGDSVSLAGITPLSTADGPGKHQTFVASTLRGTTDVRLVWLPMNRSSLRLCWQVVLTSPSRDQMFLVLLDARTGAVTLRRCLTENITNATYRVFNTYGPTPFLIGFPTNSAAQTVSGFPSPATNQPPQVTRALIVTNALSTNASPNGWIDDSINETAGNNVDAHLDRDANDLPDLPRPHGAPFRVFDFPLDLTQDPSSNGSPAVVNVFYWCNWMHDKLYDLGFTESRGQFPVQQLRPRRNRWRPGPRRHSGWQRFQQREFLRSSRWRLRAHAAFHLQWPVSVPRFRVRYRNCPARIHARSQQSPRRRRRRNQRAAIARSR